MPETIIIKTFNNSMTLADVVAALDADNNDPRFADMSESEKDTIRDLAQTMPTVELVF